MVNEQPSSARNIRRWRILVAIPLALLLIFTVYVFWLVGSRKVDDMRSTWSAFNGEQVQRWFQIPAEAEVLRAEKYVDPIMGGGFLVEFRLPEDRQPEHWLKQIASPSDELKKSRKSSLRYDASGTVTDVYWLEYQPSARLYRARWHSD